LDDERNPSDTYNTMINDPVYLDKDWVIVRSYTEFVAKIYFRGLPFLVSFDHDLADEHYHDFIQGKGAPLQYDEYYEKTGMDCAKFLVQYCDERDLEFPAWKVHSFNFIGKKNIESYIRSYLRSKKL
jgi:hypothetical protein